MIIPSRIKIIKILIIECSKLNKNFFYNGRHVIKQNNKGPDIYKIKELKASALFGEIQNEIKLTNI